MIMKKLTPEEALRAFLQQKEVYRLEMLDPSGTFISEVLEDYADNLVTFEETPVQPETAKYANETTTGGETPAETEEPAESPETGRNEATAEPEVETVADYKPKPNKLDRTEIYSQYKQGRKPVDIAKDYGVTEAAIWYHIRRALETGQA